MRKCWHERAAAGAPLCKCCIAFSAHASFLRAGDTTLDIDAEATTVRVALLRQAEAEYSRNAPKGAG